MSIGNGQGESRRKFSGDRVANRVGRNGESGNICGRRGLDGWGRYSAMENIGEGMEGDLGRMLGNIEKVRRKSNATSPPHS